MLCPSVLVVEDEENLQLFYRDALAQAGFRTRGVRAGHEALSAFADFSPDLVLLDLRLEGEMDGFDLLTALRHQGDVRIMILTGQGGDDRLVRGLELGADNYLVKPVSKAELVSRVRAQLRRKTSGEWIEAQGAYRYGQLNIDLSQNRASVGQLHVTFGDLERRILAHLLDMPGQPVTHKELLEVGWGRRTPLVTPEDARLVQNCIYRIRAKLKSLNRGQPLIMSVPTIGFSIAPPDEAPDIYHYGDLTIDLGRSHALRGQQRATFGGVERRILIRLLHTPGQAVTCEELLEIGWRSAVSGLKRRKYRAVYNWIYRLRDKLQPLSSERRLIETVPNVGFSIAVPDQAQASGEEQGGNE